jgi:hypothetical protein
MTKDEWPRAKDDSNVEHLDSQPSVFGFSLVEQKTKYKSKKSTTLPQANNQINNLEETSQ